MTATDELRRLLDERGVEWEDFDGEPTWAGGDGRMHYARQEFTFAGLTDEVTVYHLTPEQAIDATLGRSCASCPEMDNPDSFISHLIAAERYERDATLGRGTCEVEYVSDWMGWHCKTCDMLWQGLRDQRPHYCPNCGRKVVDE